MTFEQIAKAVVDAPGIEQGIVQQTFTRDKIRIAREPGSDAWKHRMPLRNEFRVFLKSEKKFFEATGATLSAVIHEAFENVEVPMPKELLR